jgi:hypothetical protein
VSVATHTLYLCGKSSAKVSNAITELADARSSLDQQKSPQFVPWAPAIVVGCLYRPGEAICRHGGGAREVQRIRPLTRAIQQLEEELGGLLLRRERKLTHLTDFGRLLEPHLRQLAADAEAARTATLSANQSSCAATGLAGVLRSILH